jgi:hypothetical protein
MRKLSSLAAISAASILFSSVSAAQTGDNDYDFQWAPMNDAAANFFVSGKGFLGAFTGQGPSFGSAWRKCYSVDITQGGKNQSDSQFESSWFRIYQGWSAQNVLQGVNIGIVSLQAASDSDLGGDACLSPWFASVGNTGGTTSLQPLTRAFRPARLRSRSPASGISHSSGTLTPLPE